MKSCGMMDGSSGTRSVRLRGLSVALMLLSTCAYTDCADYNVMVEFGQTALLPCECPSNRPWFLLWRKVGGGPVLVRYNREEDGKEDIEIAAEYLNRTELRLLTGYCFLELHNVQRSDKGLYKCHHYISPELIDIIYLQVTESSSALSVSIQPKVYKIPSGEDVTIPCRFTPQAADVQLQVRWRAFPNVLGDPEIITFTSPNTIKVESKYKGRATLDHNIPRGKADLQLQRVMRADTRVYMCTVEVLNEDKDAVSDMTRLVVLDPPPDVSEVNVCLKR